MDFNTKALEMAYQLVEEAEKSKTGDLFAQKTPEEALLEKARLIRKVYLALTGQDQRPEVPPYR